MEKERTTEQQSVPRKRNRIRVNKFLAQTTPLSRRAADRAVAAGEVAVNGRVVKALGTTIDAFADRVTWHGAPVRVPRATGPHRYLAYYKPRNTLVTKVDPQGRATIWDRLARYRDHCNAAGRLDYESEGLLVITNDGALLARLTHPRFGVAKQYHVKVAGSPEAVALERLRRGMRVHGVLYQPVTISPLRSTAGNMWLALTLTEGRYREIRTLCAAIGHPVLKLKRIAVGPIHLGALRPGQVRRLMPREVDALRQIDRLPAGAP